MSYITTREVIVHENGKQRVIEPDTQVGKLNKDTEQTLLKLGAIKPIKTEAKQPDAKS